MADLRLAFAIALVGFIFTSKMWLEKMNTLSPEVGLLAKQLALVGTALILAHLYGSITVTHRLALGVVLVYVAFTLIFNYQSEWLEDAQVPQVERQSIDGAIYNRAKHVLGLEPERARLFTFVLVPFVLVAIGTSILHRRVVNLA
jgi:hypothetical protein